MGLLAVVKSNSQVVVLKNDSSSSFVVLKMRSSQLVGEPGILFLAHKTVLHSELSLSVPVRFFVKSLLSHGRCGRLLFC
jgi:hypothetical protein